MRENRQVAVCVHVGECVCVCVLSYMSAILIC